METQNVRRTVAKTMNKSAHQLTEAVLAKAIMGDSQSQLAAVQLLAIGLGQDTK
jgi:hypothetical protein